ncbi:chorismate binding enzyme [Leptotrichia sp. oral taxon 215 str. W9775]|uniref:anthranilate synthase component I family protein n=1 Tax=Leptotrichia sp. oral taxon 215 TaxID=712359 RepID=UPI0003AE327D|nr:anthranilate synthase component I family protein [Leptotrichia sp. oral taxon 215]ERK67674.1 chorismate binding enzyme [Leptotrichia sp. oral taxon 215 str. W9775]
MLTKEAVHYYSIIRDKFKNSYLAEDANQIIIGIDCDYIDSYEYSYKTLELFYSNQKAIAPFAGLFGIFSYETIHFFEKIEKKEKSQFEFPQFVFANAKAYLHYSKISKMYTFYGDEEKYYNFLENESFTEKPAENEIFYKIETDLDKEKEHFYDIVEKAKEYIKMGDIFQVVLSEQLCLESNIDSLEFYKKLAKANPSPYMFHFPTKYGDVVGSSPEILAEILFNNIYIAPIAGTRPRGKDANEDAFLAQDLLNDPKECAEHRMLVDLARNDIGKFARQGSVIVKNMMHVKHYQHVMHIVSEVFGQKRNDVSLFDIVSSVFPAGTLSGAPKIRAMEIIGELEEYKRNIYGGGIGFLHFNGNMQLAIVIRSAFFANRNNAADNISGKDTSEGNNVSKVFIQAGAGIVYDSVKEKEYEEITHKRASVLNIFKNNCKERG